MIEKSINRWSNGYRVIQIWTGGCRSMRVGFESFKKVREYLRKICVYASNDLIFGLKKRKKKVTPTELKIDTLCIIVLFFIQSPPFENNEIFHWIFYYFIFGLFHLIDGRKIDWSKLETVAVTLWKSKLGLKVSKKSRNIYGKLY